MPMQFTPDQDHSQIKAPFYEDANAATAPGYSTTKSFDRLQTEIGATISRLNGSFPIFRAGTFGTGRDKRYGFEIQFTYNGVPSVIQVAGLPMRSETPKKAEQVKRQALYVVNEWLKTALTSMVFTPGYTPLVQFMLVPGTGKTVGEILLQNSSLPNLNPSLSSGLDEPSH